MTAMMTIWVLFTSAIAGAFIYRMRGGAPDWPRPIEQMIFCTVFAMVMIVSGAPWWMVLFIYAVAVGFTLSGHGQYFLSMAAKAIEPERFDILLCPVFGRDPRDLGGPITQGELEEKMEFYGRKRLFLRNLAGLSLTGGLVSLNPGIVVMGHHFWPGLLLLLSGFVSKPAAYLASYKIGEDTEGGEYGHGAAQWFMAVLVAILILMVV